MKITENKKFTKTKKTGEETTLTIKCKLNHMTPHGKSINSCHSYLKSTILAMATRPRKNTSVQLVSGSTSSPTTLTSLLLLTQAHLVLPLQMVYI